MKKFFIFVIMVIVYWLGWFTCRYFDEIFKIITHCPSYELRFEINCGTVKNGWFEGKNKVNFTLTNSFYFCNTFNLIPVDIHKNPQVLNEYSLTLKHYLLYSSTNQCLDVSSFIPSSNISSTISNSLKSYSNWLYMKSGFSGTAYVKYDYFSTHPDNIIGSKLYICKLQIYRIDKNGSGYTIQRENEVYTYDSYNWYSIGGLKNE